MLFVFLYDKTFSSDGHFNYLFPRLDRSIIAFLSSLVINLAWFTQRFLIFKGACLCNIPFEKLIYVILLFIVIMNFVRIHFGQMFCNFVIL